MVLITTRESSLEEEEDCILVQRGKKGGQSEGGVFIACEGCLTWVKL